MKKALWLVAAVLLGASLSAWAQIPTGSIVGTVTDSTGAVVPNAKVTVANSAKAFTREFTSNTAGEYAAISIPLGDYTITAEASGFQKLLRSGINLTVGQTQRVDLTLTVGQVTQEVTVTGNVVRVETENAAVSDLVNSTQISKLSLNGRNWVSLALLTPGAVPDNGLNATSVGVLGNNSISFNGGRMQYNNWEIDGGNNTDEGSASTFNTYPSLDSVGEFRISTSNYGADMGKHSGATIEVATKSGTKDFHGDVYEYNRNSALAANPFFQNRVIAPVGGNAPKTQLNWNDWGYTIGGPVYIPHHWNTDKTKSFFFWSQEWRRQRNGQVVSAGVPSTLERTGNFSECDKSSPNYNASVASGCVLPHLTAGGQNCTIGSAGCLAYDTVQAMPGFNAQAFANGTDLVNGLVPLANSGPVDWTSSSSAGVNWRQEQIRWDQNISDKAQFFFRYTQDTWNTLSVPALWQWASYDTIKTPFAGPGESAVMHITYSFKPNLMNEFLAAYTTDHIALGNQPGTSCGGPCMINRPSGFQVNHFYPQNDSNPLLPGIELCGGLSFCTAEQAGNTPWFNSNPIITWKDNVVWTSGRNTFKFGFYLENYRKSEQFGFPTQGFLSNGAGGNLTTQNAMADMFLGRIQQYQEGAYVVNGVPVGGYAKGHWQMTDLEPYFQDDWKVSRKLTLNLGLRWYIYSRIHDVTQPQTVDSGFLPQLYNVKAQDPLLANGNINTAVGLANYTSYGNGLVECGHNGIPEGCQLANTFKNFAPRFGFAFDPKGDGKSVVRGGFGIYFESGNGNEAQTEGGEGNPPVSQSPSGFNIGPTAAQPNGYLNIAPGSIGPTGYTAIPGSEGWPYVMQFSLGVQHEFRGNNLLSVGYVGSLGRKLARNWTISQVPVGINTFTVPALAGTSGTDKSGLGLNPSCNAAGVCNVQALLINNTVPSTFFQNYIGYNNMQMKANGASSNYNSLQVNFRHAFSHGLTFQAVYTWSHSLDNTTSTYQQTSGQVDGLFNYQRWYGTSDTNRTNVLTFNYVYDLPFFKNSSNKFVKGAFGGWEVSGITSFYSGEPITFNCGVSGFSTGIGTSMGCNSVGPVKINKTTVNDPTYGPTVSWYNPANITQPQAAQLLANNEPGMFGYMGRNVLTGPGRNNWDITLLKNFEMPWFKGEKATWQFRWETYNTWNHTQWGPFEGNGASGINTGCLSSTPFGGACTGSSGGQLLGTVNSSYDPRIMQFGLKFIF